MASPPPGKDHRFRLRSLDYFVRWAEPVTIVGGIADRGGGRLAVSFGAALRQYRLSRNLTQEALAERAALSPTAVAALERGRNRTPRFSTLRQLARALSLTPEELDTLSQLARGVREGEPVVGAGEVAKRDEPRPGRVPSQRPGELALPQVATRSWRTAFVGRDRELEVVAAACEERSRVVVILGEPGIGKTRLVSEVARQRQGSAVLWGRCAEESLGAFAPFVEALRRFVEAAALAEPSILRDAVGGSGDLQRLVSDLASHVGPLPAPTVADAGTEQRLVFESVERLLAAWRPMMLVLDDLHWADRSTLSLLGYLARSDRLADLSIVATARPADLGPDRAGFLADLGRHVELRRIRLGRLGRTELEQLIADVVGSAPSAELVEAVMQAAEGNAFFSEEIAIHLADSGLLEQSETGLVLRQQPGSPAVPDRIRETLSQRLLALTPDAVELLSQGSVVGREFELAAAGAMCGLERSRIVEAADDAIISGLLAETEPGMVIFSHAIVQHAIADRISGSRRAEMHRRAAEVLTERWPGDGFAATDLATDLARHWAAAAVTDPSLVTTAAMWEVRAGDAALAAAGTDEAIAAYERALDLWGTSTGGHADALVRLGDALQHKGRAEEADSRFREALQLATVLRDPEVRARAAIGLGRRYPYWETDKGRLDKMEAALAALPDGRGLMSLTLKGLIVTHLINGFDPEQADRRDEIVAELRAVALDSHTPVEILRADGAHPALRRLRGSGRARRGHRPPPRPGRRGGRSAGGRRSALRGRARRGWTWPTCRVS